MKLEKLDLEHIDQWAALLAVCFDRSSEDMRQLIHWFFDMGEFLAYGIWDGDRLTAQYACLVRKLVYKDYCLLAGMSINMAVHPNYRGRGLIKQVSQPVYEGIIQKQGQLGVGFSNAQGVKVDKHSKSYGYQVIGKLQSLVVKFKDFGRQPLQLSNDLPPASEFVDDMYHSDQIHFEKNPEFLLQRYANHPLRQYRFSIWREKGNVMGIVVYKYVKIFGLRAIALLDVYGNDQAELLMQWSTAMCQTNVTFFHVLLSPNSAVKHILHTHWITLPAPVTRNPYFLTLKPLSEGLPDELFDFTQWDVIGGDVL